MLDWTANEDRAYGGCTYKATREYPLENGERLPPQAPQEWPGGTGHEECRLGRNQYHVVIGWNEHGVYFGTDAPIDIPCEPLTIRRAYLLRAQISLLEE